MNSRFQASPGWVPTKIAASRLGITPPRVVALSNKGHFSRQRRAGYWEFKADELETFARTYRKPSAYKTVQQRDVAATIRAFDLFDRGERDITKLVKTLGLGYQQVARLYRIWSIRDISKQPGIKRRAITRPGPTTERPTLLKQFVEAQKEQSRREAKKDESPFDRNLRAFFEKVPDYRK